MTTLTEEEANQLSRLLNKLGLPPGKAYSLDELRAVIAATEEKKWITVKQDNIITGYIISELREDGELNRIFMSRSYEESVQKLMEWTKDSSVDGKEEASECSVEVPQAGEEMAFGSCSSKEGEEEKEDVVNEEEWITVRHRVRGRHGRGNRKRSFEFDAGWTDPKKPNWKN